MPGRPPPGRAAAGETPPFVPLLPLSLLLPSFPLPLPLSSYNLPYSYPPYNPPFPRNAALLHRTGYWRGDGLGGNKTTGGHRERLFDSWRVSNLCWQGGVVRRGGRRRRAKREKPAVFSYLLSFSLVFSRLLLFSLVFACLHDGQFPSGL